MGLSSRKLVESRGSEQNCMKISQGFASLWYGHANMAFKASSALPECRQTPHRWPAFLRYCSSFAQQILVEVFHGRTSWQLEKVNLSIFVVYCDVCLVAKFRINPTAFCVNVSPSTSPLCVRFSCGFWLQKDIQFVYISKCCQVRCQPKDTFWQ